MRYIKFYRYLLPFWKKEVLVLLLSGMTMLLGLVNPYLTKLIIDRAYLNRDLKLFIILIAIGGIIFIFNGIISGLSNYLNRYINLRVNFDLNRKVFEKLQHSSYCFFQDTSSGEHLYKISYDIERVTGFITDTLPQAISLLPKSLFILVIVLFLNWKMAVFALALTPFLYLAPYYVTKRLKKKLRIWLEMSQSIFKRTHEVLTHIQLIKAFGKEGDEIKRYIRSLIEKIRFGLANTRLEITGLFANSLANRIVLGLITFYGGYQVIKGEMSLGSLTAITIYLSQLSGLQSSFAQFFQQISLGFVSCERLEMILDAQPYGIIEDKNAKEIIFSKGNIEFREVTFGYKEDKMILQNLGFFIKGGSHIALVGPSGCGKTTIINLILRLYRLYDGEILIDGCDISQIRPKSFYTQIGVVLQEPFLWNNTIENNIKYGKIAANFKEIKEVAEISCINNFIDTLPQGYNTVIGENACKISEGQKQRIAIARALIKKPKILILDEAMSSMDSASEEKIIRNIKENYKEITIIFVSHRLSTVMACDLAYFLKSPDEIIIGPAQQLLETNERFYNLFSAQIEKKIILTYS